MSYRSRLSAGQQAAGRDHAAILESFRRVFRTPEGAIALDEIVRMSGVDASGWHPDADMRAYIAGKRDVALLIWKLAHGETSDKPEVKK